MIEQSGQLRGARVITGFKDVQNKLELDQPL